MAMCCWIVQERTGYVHSVASTREVAAEWAKRNPTVKEDNVQILCIPYFLSLDDGPKVGGEQ